MGWPWDGWFGPSRPPQQPPQQGGYPGGQQPPPQQGGYPDGQQPPPQQGGYPGGQQPPPQQGGYPGGQQPPPQQPPQQPPAPSAPPIGPAQNPYVAPPPPVHKPPPPPWIDPRDPNIGVRNHQNGTVEYYEKRGSGSIFIRYTTRPEQRSNSYGQRWMEHVPVNVVTFTDRSTGFSFTTASAPLSGYQSADGKEGVFMSGSDPFGRAILRPELRCDGRARRIQGEEYGPSDVDMAEALTAQKIRQFTDAHPVFATKIGSFNVTWYKGAPVTLGDIAQNFNVPVNMEPCAKATPAGPRPSDPYRGQ